MLPLSFKEILRFYLPLVLTSQMMTLSVPLINLGLGRVDEAALALAGYAVGVSVSVFLNAPVLSARHATAALVAGPRSYRDLARFMRLAGVGIGVLELTLATTPLGAWAFEGLLGAPAAVADQARLAIGLQAPIPLFLVERGLHQGLALVYRRTALITASTVARLAMLTATVLLLAVVFRLPGAASGALALTIGVGAEALLIRRIVRGRFDLSSGMSPAASADRPLAAGEILRFTFPLMVNHSVWALQRPLINAVIARLADPVTALAAFGIVQPLFLFIGSPLFGLTSTVQVLARTREDLLRLARFTGGVVIFLAAAVAVFSGPAGGIVLSRFYRLEPHLVQVAVPALAWIWMGPLLAGCRCFGQGILLRIRRTGPILYAALLRVALVMAAGIWLVSRDPGANGALLGITLLLLGDAWDMVVACGWGAAGSRRALPTLASEVAATAAVSRTAPRG